MRPIRSLLLTGALLSSGCAGTEESREDEEVSAHKSAIIEQPSELIIKGRRFVPLASLTRGELDELRDPELWKPPQTVEKLATNLRAHMLHMEHVRVHRGRAELEAGADLVGTRGITHQGQ